MQQEDAVGFHVKDGKFFEIYYSPTEIPTLGIPRYDLGNRTVIPGIIDSHGHLGFLGEKLNQVDLNGLDSISKIKSTLLNWINERKISKNSFVLGNGWDHTKWSTVFPTMRDLSDPVLDQYKLVLTRTDYHAFWVNQKTINLVDPLEIANRSDIIDGIFLDDAMPLVQQLIPVNNQSYITCLKLASELVASMGITTVHDAGMYPEQLELLQKAYEMNLIKTRTYSMVTCRDPLQICYSKPSKPSEKLEISAVKLFLDGALGSWGASMLEPYNGTFILILDEPSKQGFLRIEQSKLVNLVKEWSNLNFQVNIHAIGDNANRVALNALAYSSRKRNRIEHSQILDFQDIPRFSENQIVASMQPTHAISDMDYCEQRIGNRSKGAYAWRSLLNYSTVLAFGSDFPVENPNPFHGIHAAITRTNKNHDPNGWFPEQKLSRKQALKAFTINGAFASFSEHKTGSIAKGKLADFVILDRDINQVTLSELKETRVEATIIGGEIVYKNPFVSIFK